MIPIKNEREIAVMRRACKITAAARALAGEMVRPGVTTKEIDKAVYDFIVSQGARPAFLNYCGYPASVCISVNNTVIHGIPGGRVLKEGDIVSIDVGALWTGFNGACAATYDKGQLFFVIDADEQYVYLADGKSRKLEKPKRKKRRHVQAAFQTESRIAEKIRNGEKVLNSELRKELASLGQKQSQNQGG